MKTFLILILFSFNAIAFVKTSVKNEEELFINQRTNVWCWAATAEALFNYHNKDAMIDQEGLAINNPYTKDPVVPYYFQSDENGDDYLINALKTKKYRPRLRQFSKAKAIELIDHNTPFTISQNNHVRIVFAYINWGTQTTFFIFDPGSHLMNQPSVYAVDSSHFFSILNMPLGSMMYLEKRG